MQVSFNAISLSLWCVRFWICNSHSHVLSLSTFFILAESSTIHSMPLLYRRFAQWLIQFIIMKRATVLWSRPSWHVTHMFRKLACAQICSFYRSIASQIPKFYRAFFSFILNHDEIFEPDWNRKDIQLNYKVNVRGQSRWGLTFMNNLTILKIVIFAPALSLWSLYLVLQYKSRTYLQLHPLSRRRALNK